MGNEMGNNNTSGLREEDNTAQDKSLQEFGHADDLKGQNHVVPATLDKDSQGKETGLLSGHDQNTENKEEDNMKTGGKKSLQDAARTKNDKEQNHEVPAYEDIYVNEKETGLVSINLEEVKEPHDDNQKQDEKDSEKSLQEAGYEDEAKGQDHLVPAAEGKITHGNETEVGSSEHDGLASPHVEDRKQDEKEQDSSTIPETEEIPLQEAQLVPAGGEENTHGTETELVLSDRDGMAYPRLDKQKYDEKEEDININDEAEEQSSQESASTDVLERQDHLLAAVENKTNHGNETGLVSSDLEKEENNTNAEPQEKLLAKDDHEEVIEEKNLTIPAAEGEDYNNIEAELASSDPVVVGDTLDNQTLEGQEQGKTELHLPSESTKVDAKPSEEVSEGSETQPASSSKNLEDQEMQKESNFESNLSGRTHHFENQNSMMEEDEGTSNSISGAESSTSHDSVPQETAVLEPEEHELAKFHTEQLKSEDMIIPSFTCRDQENGFILDSSIPIDMVERVFPDQSLEIGKERDEFSAKEMATKEMSSEEKFELKDGDEAGNNLGTITTIMTDLPKGFGAICNGELPSEMNSIKNDSPESQVEAILSDETQTEDKGIVLSQKATPPVMEESENVNSKHSHCQIQYGDQEDSNEKSNGQGSEEGSKADEQNASPPQFNMNGHQKEEKRCQFEGAKILENGHLIDASINYQNEATEEQQKDSQKEVQLVTDHAVISADTFLTDQNYKEEELQEKKIIEEIVEKQKGSNPIGKQCISRSYPIEEAKAFLSPSPFLHALPEKQQQHDSDMAEVKQESSGEFSTTEASSFVTKNLTEKNVVSIVEFAGEKPLWDLSERPKPTPVTMAETKPSVKQSCSEQCAIGETPEAIANGDYYQRENVGRLSIESNPDNTSVHAQMRKSPSFDLDLRIDARAEDSDQTPLLYQDKTTIQSFSSQADVTDPGKNSSQYEAMAVQEEAVTLERSDSEKSSKTPFLGFLKEEEEADDHMLINPKKPDNQFAAKKAATKVSAKDVKSATTKGKEKRKPRTSLFGTCMCCATVTN